MFPLYWRLLDAVPSNQIVAYRVTLAAIVLGGLGALSSRVDLRKLFADRRTVAVHALSGLLIGINWLAFLTAVALDRVVESSLGYFMTPLVSVLLATVVLRERLSALQWTAVGIAASAVAVLTIEAGVVPWIAVVLAASFGLYGLVRKLSPMESLDGLTTEVLLLVAPAAGYLLWQATAGDLVVPSGWRFGVLGFAGVVTVTPLLLFAAAARTIPLSAIGILQYINPLMQFVVGAFIFGEAMSTARYVGFAIIWCGLAVFAADGWLRRPRMGSAVVVESAPGLAAE